MIGKHWLFQVIMVIIVFNIDYNLGVPFSAVIAALYFFGILISLIKRDNYIAIRRVGYMFFFIALGVTAAVLSDAEPMFDLQEFIDLTVYDLWFH